MVGLGLFLSGVCSIFSSLRAFVVVLFLTFRDPFFLFDLMLDILVTTGIFCAFMFLSVDIGWVYLVGVV